MKRTTFLLFFIAVLCSGLNAQVQAVRSYDVYNSVGVNTHWTYGAPYQYLPQFSTLVSMVQQAKIHHIRDVEWGNGADTAPWVTSMWTLLNMAGIKSDLIAVGNSQTQAQLEADLKLYPGVESIEAPNEWDVNGGSNWVSTMLAKLPILHQAGLDLGLSVIGPSLVEESSFAQLGDVANYMTYGNVHDYQGNRNPETTGWGGVDAEGNGYGSILWNVDMAHEYAPGLPVMATETGYQTGTTSGTVPETVEGTYAPRLYLASFLSGLPRTYIYELIDDPDGWSSYGLLRYDMSAKPAYNAIGNLLSILQDEDTEFAPEWLNYSLAGNMTGVETLLIQKTTGDFYLAVWLDGSIYNVNTQAATPVAAQPLTLSIPIGSIVSGVYSFNPNGTVTTASPNQSAYSVNANSCVTLIHITSATPASTPVLALPSGVYKSAQSVAITDTTPGAQIFYTTDGTPPTTASTPYTGPIAVTGNQTVQAIASAAGYSNSAIASAAYTINLTNLTGSSFKISGSHVILAAGATTGNTTTLILTPVGGFTGTVALSAAVTSIPAGAHDPPALSFGSTSRASITGSTAGTATLTISTIPSTSSALAYSKRPGTPWYATGGAVLASLLLFGIPARRRSWRSTLEMLTLLVALTASVTGCSGVAIAGTSAGAYTITVTGTSGSTTETGTVNLTVQ